MYVHLVSYKVKEGEEITFVELQKFEELNDAKPAGLDHFHIFKDRNDATRFFLVEYWYHKKDRDNLGKTEDHRYFHELQKMAVEKQYETFECDLIV